MESKAESRFFKWFGAAAIGTAAGLIIGAVIGIVLGGGLGGYFWLSMRYDGFNAVNDDTENLFGFVCFAVLAIIGAAIGVLTGGVAGFTVSSLWSVLLGKK